jgi:serine-type D-Ala-D-Ala carboxypeptidase/endopeptidase (penicillin-binding protein 4)
MNSLAARLLVCSISLVTAMPQVAAQGNATAPNAATAPTAPVIVEPEETELDDGTSAAPGTVSLAAPKEATARKAWLATSLNAVLAKASKIPGTKFTAIVVGANTVSPLASPLWSINPDQPQNLASNTKLFTAAAALTALGPGFRWRTSVLADQFDPSTGTVTGNLYVKGKGDPTLTYRDLVELAADVHAVGVRKITGKLVLDLSYFDNQDLPPHFDEQPNERASYRAAISALSIDRNAFTVVVEPGLTAAEPAVVTLEPPVTDSIRVIKPTVSTIVAGKGFIRVFSKTANNRQELTVTGKLRAGGGFDYSRFRVEDVRRFAHDALRAALRSKGIKIAPIYAVGAAPLTAKAIANHDSAPLTDVVRAMNKQSDNFIAESILKTLGAQTKKSVGPATWADGVAAVRVYAQNVAKLSGTWRVDNGSGLYGGSEVSAKQLMQLLLAVKADDRVWIDFAASLPIGGVDGTLSHRFSTSLAKGLVRAKTGTLDSVSTLAGFAGTIQSPIGFVILVNQFAKPQRGAIRALQDEMVEILVAFSQAGG